MIQPWIHKAKTDLLFIIGPSFFVLAIIFVFQDYIAEIEDNYSFYTWLFLIVFIDVAHVYATLFKTYFVADEFRKQRKRLIFLPIICFVTGIILFSFFFWKFGFLVVSGLCSCFSFYQTAIWFYEIVCEKRTEN